MESRNLKTYICGNCGHLLKTRLYGVSRTPVVFRSETMGKYPYLISIEDDEISDIKCDRKECHCSMMEIDDDISESVSAFLISKNAKLNNYKKAKIIKLFAYDDSYYTTNHTDRLFINASINIKMMGDVLKQVLTKVDELKEKDEFKCIKVSISTKWNQPDYDYDVAWDYRDRSSISDKCMHGIIIESEILSITDFPSEENFAIVKDRFMEFCNYVFGVE